MVLNKQKMEAKKVRATASKALDDEQGANRSAPTD